MADPAGAPTPGAAAQSDLLATKLHIPRPRPGFVRRERLLQQLDEGAARELTLVCAPAGFGKTSLLADWARRSQQPVAWLTLDQGDNDPTRFWRYTSAALDPVCEGIADAVGALLRGPLALEALITVVVNELAARADRLALVLDDLHLVEAAPVHDGIALLLDRLPAQLGLVLASRADPPLELARLRARGQMFELRAAELRFTSEETAALLLEAIGLELPEASLSTLASRTEGWAAGLQLAALSLRGQEDPAQVVERFSGSHRYVLDYLTEEVLDRQDELVRDFLLETSVLDRVCGPLCDAVIGRSDSQELLQAVEQANLFLMPLDEVRGWWRYHQLFADLLQVRLQREQPERVPTLHRAAAAWHEEHGLADEAIRHALAAGDAEWAARLVEQHADAFTLHLESATLNRWMKALPEEVVRSRPRLCLTQAWTALMGGRVDEAEALVSQAEHAFAAGGPFEPFEPSVARELSMSANIPAAIALFRADYARLRGDYDSAFGFAQQALGSLTPADGFTHAMVRWQLSMANWMRGWVAEAERMLVEVASDPYLQSIRPWYELGRVQQAQGRLSAALATFGHAVQHADQTTTGGMGHVGLADVLRERGELDAALDHAAMGVAFCKRFSYVQWLVTALISQAWIHQVRGDHAAAMAAISEADQAMPTREVVADVVFPVAVGARLLLTQGKVAAAASWVQARNLDIDDEPSYAREREYLVLVRVLLATGASDRALRLLERWTPLAVTQGRTGSVIELTALRALAYAACEDEPAALAALGEALALAAPEGYLRVFVDEGAPMAKLFRKLLTGEQLEEPAASPVSRDYLNRLAVAFEQAGAPILPRARRGGMVIPGLTEHLTRRELDVLGLLAAGQSNQEIADELVITLDTVKTHVTHILDKLGAGNRTQAVTRARELGLLG
jgi:LuxR family transcriptional regulator, maltose regulon positive regulatory protein